MRRFCSWLVRFWEGWGDCACFRNWRCDASKVVKINYLLHIIYLGSMGYKRKEHLSSRRPGGKCWIKSVTSEKCLDIAIMATSTYESQSCAILETLNICSSFIFPIVLRSFPYFRGWICASLIPWSLRLLSYNCHYVVRKSLIDWSLTDLACFHICWSWGGIIIGFATIKRLSTLSWFLYDWGWKSQWHHSPIMSTLKNTIFFKMRFSPFFFRCLCFHFLN